MIVIGAGVFILLLIAFIFVGWYCCCRPKPKYRHSGDPIQTHPVGSRTDRVQNNWSSYQQFRHQDEVVIDRYDPARERRRETRRSRRAERNRRDQQQQLAQTDGQLAPVWAISSDVQMVNPPPPNYEDLFPSEGSEGVVNQAESKEDWEGLDRAQDGNKIAARADELNYRPSTGGQ